MRQGEESLEGWILFTFEVCEPGLLLDRRKAKEIDSIQEAVDGWKSSSQLFGEAELARADRFVARDQSVEERVECVDAALRMCHAVVNSRAFSGQGRQGRRPEDTATG